MVFYDFPQFSQANVGTGSRVGHDHFHPNPFEFISYQFYTVAYNLK
jgi:hypothetical protein